MDSQIRCSEPLPAVNFTRCTWLSMADKAKWCNYKAIEMETEVWNAISFHVCHLIDKITNVKLDDMEYTIKTKRELWYELPMLVQSTFHPSSYIVHLLGRRSRKKRPTNETWMNHELCCIHFLICTHDSGKVQPSTIAPKDKAFRRRSRQWFVTHGRVSCLFFAAHAVVKTWMTIGKHIPQISSL